MLDYAIESVMGGRGRRVALLSNGAPVPYLDVVRLWQDDPPFRARFISVLKDAPFAGYRWETPPVSAATVGRAFEFVLLDTPGLARTPDPHAFAAQFAAPGAGRDVVTFSNLGKDAVLVVPRPAGPPEAYVHLASFVRGAPEAQVHELWRATGAAVEARLGAAPLWLSTAGMGVAWLHVRLDSRPKYYGYEPYCVG